MKFHGTLIEPCCSRRKLSAVAAMLAILAIAVWIFVLWLFRDKHGRSFDFSTEAVAKLVVNSNEKAYGLQEIVSFEMPQARNQEVLDLFQLPMTEKGPIKADSIQRMKDAGIWLGTLHMHFKNGDVKHFDYYCSCSGVLRV